MLYEPRTGRWGCEINLLNKWIIILASFFSEWVLLSDISSETVFPFFLKQSQSREWDLKSANFPCEVKHKLIIMNPLPFYSFINDLFNHSFERTFFSATPDGLTSVFSYFTQSNVLSEVKILSRYFKF